MLEHILGLYSIVAVAWVGALVADLVINKPLGLSPAGIEFKRAHLYDINPVGVGSMLAATAAGIVAFSGVFGTTMQSLASFLALAVAFVDGARHRLCDQGPFLHRPRAAAGTGAAMHVDPLRHLRASVRDRGHGALPGLFRADLLAVLLARNPLPRLLQAAGAHLDSRRCGLFGQILPDWIVRAAQHRCRPISRRAPALRRRDRLGAVAGLLSGFARYRRAQGRSCARRSGACSSSSRSSPASPPGCSCWRRTAAVSPRRRAAARPTC